MEDKACFLISITNSKALTLEMSLNITHSEKFLSIVSLC